jgi:hypothetical protein
MEELSENVLLALVHAPASRLTHENLEEVLGDSPMADPAIENCRYFIHTFSRGPLCLRCRLVPKALLRLENYLIPVNISIISLV